MKEKEAALEMLQTENLKKENERLRIYIKQIEQKNQNLMEQIIQLQKEIDKYTRI